MADLISPKTRLEFREYFVRTTIARIDDAFRLAAIPLDQRYQPTTSGARRSHVEKYYSSVDFTRWGDVKKVLVVYEHVLQDLEHQVKHAAPPPHAGYAQGSLEQLRQCLQRDGFVWDGDRLAQAASLSSFQGVHDAIVGLDAPELGRQLTRLRDSVNDDPALAVGTAKEILETTCKTILEDLRVDVDAGWDVPTLLKETRKQLHLLPEDIPSSAKGAEAIRRLLSNLGQIGHGLSELRNLYGSGHGREPRAKGLSPRHSRLAVGAVATLVQFLFETHQERKTA